MPRWSFHTHHLENPNLSTSFPVTDDAASIPWGGVHSAGRATTLLFCQAHHLTTLPFDHRVQCLILAQRDFGPPSPFCRTIVFPYRFGHLSEYGTQLLRVPLCLGYKRFFFGDTTFREGGAYFGIKKNFMGDTKTFFGDTKCFFGIQNVFGKQKFLVDQNPKTSQKLQQYKNNFVFFSKEKQKKHFFKIFSCFSNILI